MLFLTQIGLRFSPNLIQIWYFSYFALQIPLRYFCNYCFLFLSVFLMQYMKKAYWYCQIFCFFTTLNLIWPKFCPKTTPTFFLFSNFQWNMLGDSININNLCCTVQYFWKKLVKPLKISVLGPNFLVEIRKADHQLSETFFD